MSSFICERTWSPDPQRRLAAVLWRRVSGKTVMGYRELRGETQGVWVVGRIRDSRARARLTAGRRGCTRAWAGRFCDCAGLVSPERNLKTSK